jgi:hypothetical protein
MRNLHSSQTLVVYCKSKTRAKECIYNTGLVVKTRIRGTSETVFVVYYESRKRELKIRLMNEGRCGERLKARVEESTYLTYTGLHDKTN